MEKDQNIVKLSDNVASRPSLNLNLIFLTGGLWTPIDPRRGSRAAVLNLFLLHGPLKFKKISTDP